MVEAIRKYLSNPFVIVPLAFLAGFPAAWSAKWLLGLSHDAYFYMYVVGLTTAVGVGFALYSTLSPHVELDTLSLGINSNNKLSVRVSRRHREVAWIILVEMTSRVVVQDLPDNEGRSDSALNSVYVFFTKTRDLLCDMGPTSTHDGKSIEYLALAMLNSHIRPFLTKWHSIEADCNGSFGSVESEFRRSLRDLQNDVKPFVPEIAKIAKIQDAKAFY
jgi:hypothetical protein